jgi:hypothetical protein
MAAATRSHLHYLSSVTCFLHFAAGLLPVFASACRGLTGALQQQQQAWDIARLATMLGLSRSLLVIWTQLVTAWPHSIATADCKLQSTLKPVADLAVALLQKCGSSSEAPNSQQQQGQGCNAAASSSSSSSRDGSVLQEAQADAAALVLDAAKVFSSAITETHITQAGLNSGLAAMCGMPSVHALLLLLVACNACDLHKQQQGQSPLLLAKVYHRSLTGVFEGIAAAVDIQQGEYVCVPPYHEAVFDQLAGGVLPAAAAAAGGGPGAAAASSSARASSSSGSRSNNARKPAGKPSSAAAAAASSSGRSGSSCSSSIQDATGAAVKAMVQCYAVKCPGGSHEGMIELCDALGIQNDGTSASICGDRLSSAGSSSSSSSSSRGAAGAPASDSSPFLLPQQLQLSSMMVAAEVALLLPKHDVVHECLTIFSGAMPSQAQIAEIRKSSSSSSDDDEQVKLLAHRALHLMLLMLAPAVLAACKQEETDGLQQIPEQQQQQQQQQQQEVAEQWEPIRKMLGLNIGRAIQAGGCAVMLVLQCAVSATSAPVYRCDMVTACACGLVGFMNSIRTRLLRCW